MDKQTETFKINKNSYIEKQTIMKSKHTMAKIHTYILVMQKEKMHNLKTILKLQTMA